MPSRALRCQHGVAGKLLALPPLVLTECAGGEGRVDRQRRQLGSQKFWRAARVLEQQVGPARSITPANFEPWCGDIGSEKCANWLEGAAENWDRGEPQPAGGAGDVRTGCRRRCSR